MDKPLSCSNQTRNNMGAGEDIQQCSGPCVRDKILKNTRTCCNGLQNYQALTYLIFVTSTSSGASVIFLTEGNFSQWNQKELQYSVCILDKVCNFTRSV